MSIIFTEKINKMRLKLNYDKILKEFNHNLIHKLRQHGLEKKFLSLWVPNDDFLESFKSLSLSLKDNGIEGFDIEVKKETIEKKDFNQIKKFFKNIEILENKKNFIISVNQISLFKEEKNIIDQVKKKNLSKIDYIYGSLRVNKEQKKIKEYFLSIYKIKFNQLKKKVSNIHSDLKSKRIIIANQNYVIKFTKENDFVGLFSNTENHNLLGALLIFNKLFSGRKLNDILNDGIDEFIKYILESTQTKIQGIVLPFNLGEEIFIIHKIWRKFTKYYEKDISIRVIKSNSSWSMLDKNKRELQCKKNIQLFLKKNNVELDLILFNYIEKDLSGQPIRIFIDIKESISSLKKPDLIRRLEKFLKDSLDSGLQVFYQEKKDLNKIRRL